MDKAHPLIVWLAKENPHFFTLAGHIKDNLGEAGVTLLYVYILNSGGCIRYFWKFLLILLPCKMEFQSYHSKKRLEGEAHRRDLKDMGVDTLRVQVHVHGLLLWQDNTVLFCGFAAAYILMQPNEFPSLRPDLLLTVK